MDLRAFLDSFSKYDRQEIQQMIADAHDVSIITVQSWVDGTRKHPYSMSALEITESVTGGRVTRYDLRPDIFGEKK